MSGFLDFIHLAMGVLSVASVMFINYRLYSHRFFEDDIEDINQLRFGRAFYYLFWMIYQILLAGFHVVSVIIRPTMPVTPSILTFKTDLPSSHAKMILGNSITLTPGTLTIDIKGDTFTVHALNEHSYEGIVNDEMPRQVLKLFSKEDRPVIYDMEIKTGGDS